MRRLLCFWASVTEMVAQGDALTAAVVVTIFYEE